MGVGARLYMYVVVVQKFTFAISSPDEFLCCYDNIAPHVLTFGAHDSIAAKAANAKYQLVHVCIRFVPGSFKATFHYAIWS